MTDFSFYIPISKVEKQKDGSVVVEGYATTQTLDLDGEIVSIDAVKKALPSYWEYRNIREMHQPSAVGRAQDYNVDDIGCFLRAKISDPLAAQKCLDKVYNGYSIGGRKLAKNGNTITDLELIEISIVDRPANPDCRISVAKRAKNAKDGAYLLKSRIPRDLKDKALSKMAQAVELISKAGPSAAHDGFSLPAPGPNRSPKDETIQNNKSSGACEEHGVVGCKECMDKISDEARHQAKEESKTEPGEGERFPIRNKEDLGRARRAIGRSKTPGKTRAWIRTRARALGVKLPDKWKKKEAKKLIKEFEKKEAKKAPLNYKSHTFDGITLEEKAVIDNPNDLTVLRSQPSSDDDFPHNLLENSEMTDLAVSDSNISDLDTAVLDIIKRSMVPSREKRMSIARGNLKKARQARKEAEEEVKNCHAAISKKYMAKMAKAGKKKPDDDDDDDMAETEKVLKGLQKAYSALTTMKTFIKAADSHLEKAAARSGQRGQETNDPAGDTPTGKPEGLRDLSPGEMATAGGGSQPPMYSSDRPYPGKMAKLADRNGMLPVAVAEILAENARLEGEVSLLGKVARPNNQPYAFDVSKVYGGQGSQSESRRKAEIVFQGVDPNDLQSPDENIRRKAVAITAGNYLLSPSFGKSIVSPDFRGKAGMGKGA